MLKSKITLLILLIISCCNFAMAQDFSSDKIELANQLDQLFVKYQRPNTQEILNEFKSITLESYSVQTVEQTARLFSIMAAKKVKPVPGFEKLLNCLNEFNKVEFTNGKKLRDDWLKTTVQFLNIQKKLKTIAFQDFLKFSELFLTEKALYKSSAKVWKIEGNDFEFIFENEIPLLKIGKTNLAAVAKKDSIIIRETAGVFNPGKNNWTGNGGKIRWNEYPVDSARMENAYAELSEYNIELKKPGFEALDVLFYQEEFFSKPLKGMLTQKIGISKNDRKLYPRFKSYESDLQLNKIDPKVSFKGGYGLNGIKIIVYGTDSTKASMYVKNEADKILFRSTGNLFGINNRETVKSNSTQVSLYFKNDSIYHPNLELTYKMGSKDLRVVRSSNNSLSKAPFVSSFHKVESKIDAVSWILTDTIMKFSQTTQVKDKPVFVESYNYYNPEILLKYRKAVSKDPISILAVWVESMRSDQIPAIDFARQIKPSYKTQDVLSLIYDLVADGFCFYDPLNEMITIRAKAQFYAFAEAEKSDYDMMNFKSVSSRENLFLNINTSDLSVIGVENVTLSDTQKVILFPYDKIVNINENRNIKTYGDLAAGQMDFVGGNYSFEYDPFTVKIDSANKMFLYVREEEQFRDGTVFKTKKVKTPIENVNGMLYIDNPNNKSGKNPVEDLPKFTTNGSSYIFFDNSDLFADAYDRDRFYFEIDQFEFENLKNIPKDKFVFPGKMVYGDIFPELRVTTRLDENLDLAVNSDITGNHYPMYGGIAIYDGAVNLSKKGLFGNGTIEYMRTKVQSDDFIFFPDSTLSSNVHSLISEKGVRNGIHFPDVMNSGIEFKWYPYRDTMLFYGKDKPFAIFEAKTSLKGNLMITDSGIKGSGEYLWNKAVFNSNRYTFDDVNVYADSATIFFRSEDDLKLMTSYNKMGMQLNPYNEFAKFQALQDSVIKINLPVQDYVASVDEIEWNYPENKIRLINKGVNDNYFTSKDERLEGLRIKSNTASLSTVTKELILDDVEKIIVADARIVPANKTMTVLPGAEVKTLENAEILIDTLKSYHLITNATVDIYTKSHFKASGDYQYRSEFIDQDQIIHFAEIESRLKSFEKEDEEQNEKEKTERAEDFNITKEDAPQKEKKKKKKKKKKKEKKKKEKKKKEKKPKKSKKKKKEKQEKTVEEETAETPKEIEVKTQDDEQLSVEDIGRDISENAERKRKKKGLEVQKEFVRTYSKAYINEDQGFKLDSKTDYKGRVYLASNKKFLIFNGFARINLNTQHIKPGWFQLLAEVNPDNLTVDLSDPKGEFGEKLYFGSLFSYENLSPYAAFINGKKSTADFEIISVSGLMDYNPEKQIYRVGNANKLKGEQKPGNVMAIRDNEAQQVICEGRLNLGKDFGFVKVDLGGQLEHNLQDSIIKLNEVVMGLDFMIDSKAFEIMKIDLKEVLAENEEINYLSPGFSRGIIELLPEEAVHKAMIDLAQNAYFELPEKDFVYNFLLANINFNWNDVNSSFISSDKFGIGFMKEEYVNRSVEGFIEFAPRRKGDYFHMYLKNLDPETGKDIWYYFYYRNGFMQMLSSNVNFNNAITKIKGKKRKKVSKDKQTSYQYALASPVTVNNFLYRMGELNKTKK